MASWKVLLTVAMGIGAAACSGAHTTANGGEPQGDDASTPTGDDGGTTVGADGGTMVTLEFAVVGDTRPPMMDDTAGYPTQIITKIYADVAAKNPPFVLGTGDYQFSSTSGSTASTQMDIYLMARAQYQGPFYPVMGNHECTGAVASNCGSGSSYGMTANYQAFLSKMMAPLGQTNPYYVKHFAAPDASWTAKFVFIAANAWNQTQDAWFDMAMSESTTYTFVVRHEPAIDTTAPGVSPSEAIMAKHPYTLAIVGHSHTYRKNPNKEVIIGNGGAPPTGSVNYGYGLFTQRADGAISVDMIDYQSGQPTPSMHFAVKADGTPTQ
jgi:hypothetical protein